MGKRKRAGNLRHVKAEEEIVERKEPAGKEKPMRPSECRTHLRKSLAAAFPAIVSGFVEKAKTGSCQHLKLVTVLMEDSMKPKRSSSGRRLVSRWVKEMENCAYEAE